jgi:hypothetical protein
MLMLNIPQSRYTDINFLCQAGDRNREPAGHPRQASHKVNENRMIVKNKDGLSFSL